ncbi:MAG: ferritin [candidate division Zixibacteria bacterium]|nr:ferritin [candidate division Zixibacteria bacterium]
MISKKMEGALNGQIQEEFYSAYLYLSMSAWFETKNLKGFANWMKIQNLEEQMHAIKIFDYINERGGNVQLQNINKPQNEWNSPLEAFEAAYKHEQHISGCFNDLVHLAMEEKDRASQIFLDWFVNEQVEEEATADEIVQQLRIIGDNGHGLLMIDRELGARVFTPPAQSDKNA